ncbi:single-stranded DNA-binding protein [Romboutsia sp.]|uniref:single-stranded DNA-binding protein n=1 Tax=Romboutsia sp. TaxID=1965302 RepID=UPI002B9DEE43|nr:single-stranded DNA-binding protein [Romboutsia sp.]HSQ90316.1 single-stranded DNA-binding protein [Romboutsia sp.]
MNKCLFTGRLTKDAELSFLTGSGTPKMQFTIAVERNYQKDKNNKKVDFINCEMLGKHCENLCQYVTKGKLILLEGELNIDQYEKEGEKRSFTKIKGDRLEFLGGNGDKKESNEFQEVDSDEIPF